MSIKINLTKVPKSKLTDVKFQELFQGVQDLFANPLFVNSFCVHEAAHVIYYGRAGVPIHSVVGPSIDYESEEPKLYPAQVVVQRSDIEKLGVENDVVQKIAKVHAAGKAAALALTSLSCGGEEIDLKNFRDFCNFAKVPEDERDAIWNDADKQIRKEISKPSNRDEAWREAFKIRHDLFGIPVPPGYVSAKV